MLTRVLGVVEGVFMAAFGVGSVVVPAVILLTSPTTAFVLTGLLLPAAVLVAWRPLRAIDAAAVVPVREIALLRGIPLFERLSPPVLEQLALHLEPMTFPIGEAIVRQGDPGDRLYVIATGDVDVRIDARSVGTQGAGTEFGEIALLRDVPRTATVVALTTVEVLAMPRHVFLSAMSGDAVSSRAADAVVRARLGEATP